MENYLIAIIVICSVSVFLAFAFAGISWSHLFDIQEQQKNNSVSIIDARDQIMELTNKIRICDTRLVTIQQILNSMLNSKESEKKSTKQEVEKMSYRVKPNRHEITIDFVFEHDGEEYNFKVVERDARQAILDKFVKPESRAAVDKFLKETDLWDETLDKLDTFLNEHFEEEFHRAVKKC